MLFTLEAYDANPSTKGWREYARCYHSVDEALAGADAFWEDKDHFYTKIRLKRTETVCTLIRPADDEER